MKMRRHSASSLWEQRKHLNGRAHLCVRRDWNWTDSVHVKLIYHNFNTIIQTYCSEQHAVKRKHISEEKDFSRNLWKQTIGRVSCSSSCEDKNRQYPTHKSLPDHNVTTSNFLQNIFPKTFLTDFADFLNFFSSNIRHRRFILTATLPPSYFTRNVSPKFSLWIKF